MDDEVLKDEEFKSIKIDDDLYKRVRQHCDQNGIRFKDFVEDSLENAIYTDKSSQILKDEIIKLKEKTKSYDYAFRRGFERGFLFFFLSLQGKFDCNLKKGVIEILQERTYIASKGTQLNLFHGDN